MCSGYIEKTMPATSGIHEKPHILEAIQLLKEIKLEITALKMEITHIKSYIRKEEVRKLQEIEKLREEEKEYVKTGWFF